MPLRVEAACASCHNFSFSLLLVVVVCVVVLVFLDDEKCCMCHYCQQPRKVAIAALEGDAIKIRFALG